MRCPICGSKMVQGQLCQYCKITDDQVTNASNKKVTEYRKKDMSDLIYFTDMVPKDVNRLKLILFTIFFGIFGVNHYYVKRILRGTFSLISFILSLVFIILTLAIPTLNSVVIFRLMYEIVFYSMTFNVVMWIFDIINVLIKKFKIPVVLAEKGENK